MKACYNCGEKVADDVKACPTCDGTVFDIKDVKLKLSGKTFFIPIRREDLQLPTPEMTKKDWDDAADLFEQAAVMCDMSAETHTWPACQHVAKVCRNLAIEAQGNESQL